MFSSTATQEDRSFDQELLDLIRLISWLLMGVFVLGLVMLVNLNKTQELSVCCR